MKQVSQVSQVSSFKVASLSPPGLAYFVIVSVTFVTSCMLPFTVKIEPTNNNKITPPTRMSLNQLSIIYFQVILNSVINIALQTSYF